MLASVWPAVHNCGGFLAIHMNESRAKSRHAAWRPRPEHRGDVRCPAARYTSRTHQQA